MVISERAPQSLKHASEMFVKPVGILIDMMESQFVNALEPIEVTESHNTILLNDVQFLKAPTPIVVIESGNEQSISAFELVNALAPIVVTVDGIETPDKPDFEKKARSPISVTQFPILA